MAVMLRIYPDILNWLSALVPLIEKIADHDPDLAKQLKAPVVRLP